MKIFIVGSGKLANSLLTSNWTFPCCEVLKWEEAYSVSDEKSILVHAGSGRQHAECLKFCSKTKSVFIELSTGLETEKITPGFPLIICPNTSVLVLKTLHMLKTHGKYFKDYEISITESHQSTKTTEPGTAIGFASFLNHPANKITSVRNPEVQLKQIGIAPEHLGKHAFHKIVIKDGEDEISITTKVHGHDSYARGTGKIIEAVLKYPLEDKLYSVFDLIEEGML